MQPKGITAVIMSTLSHKMNFTWTSVFPKTGEYGLQLPDGSEDGMIGDLSTKISYSISFV